MNELKQELKQLDNSIYALRNMSVDFGSKYDTILSLLEAQRPPLVHKIALQQAVEQDDVIAPASWNKRA